MAINYCDWDNGDDGTGDGTYGNPYKTITTASTSLTGGDEVRVAKSVASTDLSGTLAFVSGSISITTSVDLTGVLSAGDFVGKSTETDSWWEVISLTSTTLTLYKKYPGTTETVAAKKINTIDTEIADSNDNFQVISSSGSSDSSRLKISGGWDLSTQVQDGFTYFRQMHSTFNNRMGTGLFVNQKNYLILEKMAFLRFSNGVEINISHHIDFDSILCYSNNYYGVFSTNEESSYFSFNLCECNSNNLYGIYFYFLKHSTFNSCKCNSNAEYGIEINTATNITCDNFTCNHNMYGINIRYTSNSIIDNIICNNNTNYGLTLSNDYNFILFNIICNNNSRGIHLNLNDDIIMNTVSCNNNTDGVYLDREASIIINNFSGTGNTTDISTLAGKQYTDVPVLRMQHFKTSGDNRSYYEFGVTYRDTVEARSSQCLKFAPTSNTYYIKQKFNFVAPSGVQRTASFYIKDNTAFNGDVQAALLFMGKKITGWTTIPTTESYVQQNLVALSENIVEDGVLELYIKVRGTAGNVYVDDFEVV